VPDVIRRLALGALAALTFAGAAQALPPVWVVRDRDSELVLFGSVHVLPPGLTWKPPALAKALKAADDLWFELPIDPETAALTGRLATQQGALAPDQSLFKLLSPEDSARLSRVAATYDVSPALLDRLQPWLAEIALAGGAYRKAGADAECGVEQTIAAAAPSTAALHAFETPQEQIAMLAAGPMPEQLASLRETLKEMEDEPDAFGVLVRAWAAGDLAALDHEALEPIRKASPALFKRLVTDRNARWAQALDARLKGHGRTVVVVGVGHLIGPESLPARLRALGYSVTGP
ncbi:MAG TPA: TraB/GumN family protein, partial [Phenylobacterium sp.]|nr:TraB/GumN family protein [Phenylobacterium sp.]